MTGADKLPSERRVYLQHLMGLWPGRPVPVFGVHDTKPGDMPEWDDSELALVVDEGRRQFDRQINDLEHIRRRAQFLFTTALGLLALMFAGTKTIAAAHSPWPFIVWSVGILIATLGLLGASAVVVARKDLTMIDTTLLSRQPRPVLPTLAAAYAHAVRQGENTVATHITVYRDAVLLVLLGAVCYAAAWPLAVR